MALPLMKEATHMDDTFASYDTAKEAINAGTQCSSLLAEAQMDWSKIASNSEEVMKAFPEDKWAKNFSLISENQRVIMPTKKALGLEWQTDKDSE